MNVKVIARIVASYIPGIYRMRGTGGTTSARYCYSVWLRHLVKAYNNGFTVLPARIAELGPGDSLGIGLAALLSGANTYYACDVMEHATNKKNNEVLEELIKLFQKREPIPDDTEFPRVTPRLESYEFPGHILPEDHLDRVLKKHRIDSIHNELSSTNNSEHKEIEIRYVAPWTNIQLIEHESIDMILSQAVLEHIDNLPEAYEAISVWLVRGGCASHSIDFKCHGMASVWNGHWGYSDTMWKLIRGRREYLLNREPCSTHLSLLKKFGFHVICEMRDKEDSYSGLQRKQLASRFKDMSDDDVYTQGVFVQAIKT